MQTVLMEKKGNHAATQLQYDKTVLKLGENKVSYSVDLAPIIEAAPKNGFIVTVVEPEPTDDNRTPQAARDDEPEVRQAPKRRVIRDEQATIPVTPVDITPTEG